MGKCPRCGNVIRHPYRSWMMAGRPDKTGKRKQLAIATFYCPWCKRSFREVISVRVIGGAKLVKPPVSSKARIHLLISELSTISLSQYRVVGNYVRWDEDVRNALKDAKQRILAGLTSSAARRENHIIWAPPGSGKTYFVQEIAASLTPIVRYCELNLARLNKEDFTTRLASLEKIKEPNLCLIDEIDAKLGEPWPYETLLPYLDLATEGASRPVFVLAGSSGSCLYEMKKKIANRPKGTDVLSRIPSGNEYSIPPMGIGDRVVVALAQSALAGKRLKREVKAIEKLGLFYITLDPKLSSPRQLSEFAVRCVERMPDGEDRIKYDFLFDPGDPENKEFWMNTLSIAEDLANKFVIINARTFRP